MSSQVVLFFKDATGYGWTEKHYYNGSLTVGPLPTDLANLVAFRAMFLTSSSLILAVRAASSVSRDPFVYSLNQGAGISGGESVPTAPSEVALLIDWQGAVKGYNRSFLRGIPERVVQADSYVPDTTFNSNLQPYVNYITGSGKWNVQGTLGSPPAQLLASTGVPLPPRGFQAVVASTPPLTVGQRVKMHGWKVPGYNGLKTVTQVVAGAANTYKFGGAAPPADDLGISAFATAVVGYDNNIAAFTIIGLSRRAAGRPRGLSRGRRQNLLSLRQ